MADDEERASLWSIYFALRSLKTPPPFLLETEQTLRRHLYGGQSPEETEPPPKPQRKPKRRRPSHLSVVIGGGV